MGRGRTCPIAVLILSPPRIPDMSAVRMRLLLLRSRRYWFCRQ